jgi:hypothetical protein
MDVTQLLQLFLFAQHHKIVKPLLPYVSILYGLPQTGLLGQVSRPSLAHHLARETLLQNLHDSGNIAAVRLADEKMNVLGHNHIPDHDKLVATTQLLKDSQKPIAPTGVAEHRIATIAATGDEVEMSGIVFSS